MEQCLKKRGVTNEDRISELPEALLLQILSLLATKDVIATSVLSKGWRSLWKMVPRLEFVSPFQKFARSGVGRSLLSHQTPVLESLHLRVRDICDIGDIGVLAGIAVARHVREFVLDVSFFVRVPFPSSLFFSASLETLKLKKLIEVDVPSPVSMKSLKTLHLAYVTYKDAESFRNLLSGCPNLEELVMYRHFHHVDEFVRSFVIVAPSLQRLSIYDFTDGRPSGRFVINAPRLKYLEIQNLTGYEFCLIENSPELVEANIRNVSEIVNDMNLESLKSAKRLSLNLSPLEIKCPTGSIFYQLVYLEMHTNRVEWWNLLALMLDSSPKLQVLKLVDGLSHREHWRYNRKHCLGGKKWSEPECVPECLLSHLKTFVWTRYDWRRQEAKEVASYIIRNARRLTKATLSINRHIEERLDMLKELNSLVRVSHSCQFVLEFE